MSTVRREVLRLARSGSVALGREPAGAEDRAVTDPTALEDLVLAAFVLGGLLVTAAAILQDVRAQTRAGAATSQGGA